VRWDEFNENPTILAFPSSETMFSSKESPLHMENIDTGGTNNSDFDFEFDSTTYA
jgi:hypothetical protein